MVKLNENLEEHDYVIHKALSDMIDISEDDAKELTNTMDLGDYIQLTQALDTEDIDEVREVVDNYMDEFPHLDIDKSDNSGDEDEEMDEAKGSKKGSQKNQTAPRNKAAVAAKQRNSAGPMDQTWKKKKDKMKDPARKASKGARGNLAKNIDVEENKVSESGLQRGDRVLYRDQYATVKYPKAPKGTVGVMVNEQLHMARPNELKKVDEGVMGMSNVPALSRMRKLSGINEDDYGMPEDDSVEFEPDFDVPAEPTSVADVEDDMADDMGMSDEMDTEMGMDHYGQPIEQEPSDSLSVADSGYTSDVMPVQDQGAEGSEAFTTINNCLDQIRNNIPDIRLDEYKAILQQLQDMQDHVRSMGRSYLGERRKKK